jgi:hypothetical protein
MPVSTMSGDLASRIGAHARIRTGDLFLTNWSSVPGEFESIVARRRDFN